MLIPWSSNPFFGREGDRGRLLAALRTPDLRLLTLTGLGGIGKTSLAMNVAAEMQEEFPDGVFWIPLAALSDHTLVGTSIARQLSVPENAPQQPAEAIAEFLNGKRTLVVLDNFEQVIEARSLVARLVATTTPGSVFLITSRRLLEIPDEHWVEVGPLPLPDADRPTVESLRDNEAARLFEWRARVAGLNFAIDAGNAADVAALCRVLDGIPLAIELAASRAHLLGTRGLLQHLQPRLGLLRTGSAEFPTRHRAMADAIAWSYQLLGDKQEFFRRLCIFNGGFSIEAAEEVGIVADLSGNASSARDGTATRRQIVIEALEELVGLSLVRGQPLLDGTVRYVILETIREFGLSEMSAEEEEDTNWAHARYFLLLAERAQPELSGADSGLWVERLELEHDNLRAAISWLLSLGPVGATTALRLGWALWVFWKIQGHLTEGRTWLQRIREQAAGEDDLLLGRVTLALGHFEFDDLARGETLYAEAQELFRRVGDARGEAEAWGGLGMIYEQRGDYDRSSAAHRESLAVWRNLGHESGIALASYQLGYAAIRAGSYREALTLLDDARERWERSRDLGGVSYATMEMGRAYRLLGQFQEARLLLTLSEERFHRAGIRDVEGIVKTEIGLLDLAAGDAARALELLQPALVSFMELGITHAYLLEALEGIAAIAATHGDERAALRLALFVVQQRGRSGRGAPVSSKTLIDIVAKRVVKALDPQLTPAIKVEASVLSLEEAVEQALAIRPIDQPAPVDDVPATPVTEAPFGVLTAREREVLPLIAQGMTDQEISDALFISYRTTTTHVSHILSKLGVTSRTSAAAWAFRLGLFDPPIAG